MITGKIDPVFYDCEASCIGGLPIEIAWAFVDPTTGEIPFGKPFRQAARAEHRDRNDHTREIDDLLRYANSFGSEDYADRGPTPEGFAEGPPAQRQVVEQFWSQVREAEALLFSASAGQIPSPASSVSVTPTAKLLRTRRLARISNSTARLSGKLGLRPDRQP